MRLKFYPPVVKYTKVFAPADFHNLIEFDPVTFGRDNDYTADVDDTIGALILKQDSRFSKVEPDLIDDSLIDSPISPKPSKKSAGDPVPVNDSNDD